MEKSGEKYRIRGSDPIGTIRMKGRGRGSLIKRLGDMPDGPRRTRLSGDPRTYK